MTKEGDRSFMSETGGADATPVSPIPLKATPFADGIPVGQEPVTLPPASNPFAGLSTENTPTPIGQEPMTALPITGLEEDTVSSSATREGPNEALRRIMQRLTPFQFVNKKDASPQQTTPKENPVNTHNEPLPPETVKEIAVMCLEKLDAGEEASLAAVLDKNWPHISGLQIANVTGELYRLIKEREASQAPQVETVDAGIVDLVARRALKEADNNDYIGEPVKKA